MKRLSVMIVDDERVIADSLAAIFLTKGFKALAVYSAYEALAAASRVRPDVLISDVVMPGMNGIELSEHFAQMFPTCKVLLMSGNAKTGPLLAESESQGRAHTVLVKPFHPEELLDLVATSD